MKLRAIFNEDRARPVTSSRLIVLVVALAASPAWALNFFELEVYPATTEGKGLHEIELHTNYVPDGRKPSDEELSGDDFRRQGLFRTSIEYNYGLTDKIDAAAYTDLVWPDGEGPQYAGNRFRLRGSPFDKGRFPVDVGWYFEVEVPQKDAAKLELEFRPMLSRDFGRFTVDLNPGFELPTVTSERRTIEFNYGARLLYRLAPQIEPAVEFYGGIGEIRDSDPSREQEHYVSPMVFGRIAQGVYASGGLMFGITRSSDPVIMRFAIEYEFSL
jgi:hypothetical protein